MFHNTCRGTYAIKCVFYYTNNANNVQGRVRNAKAAKIVNRVKKLVKSISEKGNQIKLKRKDYFSEAVQKGLEAVSQGVSFRKAANTYGVPAGTLCRKKKNSNKKN